MSNLLTKARERTSVGFRVASGALATVATAVGLLATLGVIGGATETSASAAVASAASKASGAGSSKVLVTIVETPSGTPTGPAQTTLAAGSFDFRRGRGRMEYDYSRRKGLEDLYSVEVIFNGPTFFVENDAALGLPVPKGKHWVRVRFADSAKSPVAFLGVFDPTQILAELESRTSGAKRIGTETIRGEPMKHYRIERDPDGPGPARPLTKDVWVDRDGFLRRLETVTRSASKTVLSRTEFDDYGVEANTKLPPRSRVYDRATGT
jgi:hypothetical protein